LQDGLLPLPRQGVDALRKRLPAGIADQIRPDKPVRFEPLGVLARNREQRIADLGRTEADILGELRLFFRRGVALLLVNLNGQFDQVDVAFRCVEP
jgi:hypothetical protein